MMYAKSNLIKDLDGKLYRLDKLYEGEKVEVLPQEASKYDMLPMAGFIHVGDGKVVSEVDLILSSGGGKVDLSEYFTKNEIIELLKDKSSLNHTHTQYLEKTSNELQTIEKDVIGAINEVFQFGVNRKDEIVTAINAVGAELPYECTWEELVSSILNLSPNGDDVSNDWKILQSKLRQVIRYDNFVNTVKSKALISVTKDQEKYVYALDVAQDYVSSESISFNGNSSDNTDANKYCELLSDKEEITLEEIPFEEGCFVYTTTLKNNVDNIIFEEKITEVKN